MPLLPVVTHSRASRLFVFVLARMLGHRPSKSLEEALCVCVFPADAGTDDVMPSNVQGGARSDLDADHEDPRLKLRFRVEPCLYENAEREASQTVRDMVSLLTAPYREIIFKEQIRLL